jgi:hypothetical protein
MITKLNTNPILRFFLDHDNLIKSKTKSIMKLDSQSVQYQRMKLKKNYKKEKKKKLNSSYPITSHELSKI